MQPSEKVAGKKIEKSHVKVESRKKKRLQKGKIPKDNREIDQKGAAEIK